MLLDVVHKHLHVGSGQSMGSDRGINLAAERLQKSELISIEWLGTVMG